MHSDGRTIPAGTIIETELLIIGAGPAGITLAAELVDSGIQVMLTESGDLNKNDEADALSQGRSAVERFASLDMYRRRVFGGASVIWGGRCIPYDAIDFEKRDYVPESGWPFDKSELDPWYKRAAEYCEIGKADFDARTSLKDPREFIAGFSSDIVGTTSFERFSAPTDFGKRWRPVIDAASNVKTVTGATCTKLLTSADVARIVEARFSTLAGNSFCVRAKSYVIAAGGFETYRLLAASNDFHAAGLGNTSDTLGRYLMAHIEGSLANLRLQDPASPIDWGFQITPEGIYGRRRFTLVPEVQKAEKILNFIVRLHHPTAVDPSHGSAILSLMFLAKQFILPEYRRKMTMVERRVANTMPQGLPFWAQHLSNLVRGAPELATFLVEWIYKRHFQYHRIPYVALRSRNGIYPIDFNSEQIPNPDSRVILTDQKDRFGVPVMFVDWRMTETDVASIARSFRLMRSAFADSGVVALDFDDASLEDRIREETVPVGGHCIGVTRMSNNPRTGVVNPDLRMHDVPNAFVLSAASLPTCSHANPTLTLVAMAARLANHLRAGGAMAATATQ